jgi:ribosomal protein L7/L12
VADLGRSAKSEMAYRRFTKELNALRQSGRSFEDSLTDLRSKGATIIECIIAVKEETGCDLSEAKRVVHASKTWHDVADAAEKMWDELIDELKK